MSRLSVTKRINVDGIEYIEDYRLMNKLVPIVKGKLSDLKECHYKSSGLGDLLGSVIYGEKEIEDVSIVEYGKMYAIGFIK